MCVHRHIIAKSQYIYWKVGKKGVAFRGSSGTLTLPFCLHAKCNVSPFPNRSFRPQVKPPLNIRRARKRIPGTALYFLLVFPINFILLQVIRVIARHIHLIYGWHDSSADTVGSNWVDLLDYRIKVWYK